MCRIGGRINIDELYLTSLKETSKLTIRPPESLRHGKTFPGKCSEIKITTPPFLPIAADQKLDPGQREDKSLMASGLATKAS